MPLLLIAFALIFNASNPMQPSKNKEDLHPELRLYMDDLAPTLSEIDDERKTELRAIAEWIEGRIEKNEPARLTFICTHNSRRSHLGMIWAAAAASYYGIEGIETYSGGTEATAFNPRAVEAIKRAGFWVDAEDNTANNPRYSVSFSQKSDFLNCFSKKFDDEVNPTEGFCAVMVCSSADRNCPFVPGADFRVAIPYEDPKASDGTPQESATYDARSRQIASEMMYLLSLLK